MGAPEESRSRERSSAGFVPATVSGFRLRMMKLAYLYSRYPVVSQTFCDMEMLELERRGYNLLIGSVHPPLTSLRHEHSNRFVSPVYYAPPALVLRQWEEKTKEAERWPQALIERHDRVYGPAFKAALRARNATYFADLFTHHGVTHFHVHFANRAAHTALFVKEISGIPFSITAHGQDFMSDLGQDDLLREICAAAEFVAVETDYSRNLLQERCPEAAHKIHRVYNGLDLANLPAPPQVERPPGPTTILSVGRLVPFKGFEILLEACAELDRRNFDFRCQIVGDGPLRAKLEAMIGDLKLQDRVDLCGSLSQEEVFSRLHSCDIFALACVVDAEGASDVFPTVIMEAMACARPVVSTKLAGIPESVVDGVTGLLVPPADWEEFADALDRLVRDTELRKQFGEAGRVRMQNEFSVTKTVEPLHQLFAARLPSSSSKRRKTKSDSDVKQAAYLIDRWPDEGLPFLETELRALRRESVPFVPFVFHTPQESDLSPKTIRSRHGFSISARCDGDRGGVAGERAASAGVGSDARGPETSSAFRFVPGAGALGFDSAQAVSATLDRPRSCRQFPHLVMRAHVEKTARCDH